MTDESTPSQWALFILSKSKADWLDNMLNDEESNWMIQIEYILNNDIYSLQELTNGSALTSYYSPTAVN